MVEGGGLENRCAARYRGFESPLLRNSKSLILNIKFYRVKLFDCFAIGGQVGFQSPLLRNTSQFSLRVPSCAGVTYLEAGT